MLKQRILTALVLLPIVFWCVLGNTPYAFLLFSGSLLIVGAWEWTGLMVWNPLWQRLLYVAGVAVSVGCVGAGSGNGVVHFSVFWFAGSALLWGGALLQVIQYPQHAPWKNQWIMPLIGLWLLFPTWLALLMLKGLSTGWLVYLFLLVWGADTGAYFAGRRFGRHKLAPQVSPGKTVEGLFGGLLLTTVLELLVVWQRHMPLPHALLFLALSMVTVLASVLGDLCESMIKRSAGVKDSGRIFPGHGGVLDRIDSLTAAAPVYLLGWMLLGGF